MCGIAGLWNKTKTISASALAPALTRMRHRGPDDEGFLVIDTLSGKATPLAGDDTPAELQLPSWRESDGIAGHIVLGHRRLSIIDLSPRGHQPMRSADGRCWIVFNGEIYNYIELREELKAAGHEFHSGSDTEVILHAWQQWGEDALHRFNGDWAFCIADLSTPETSLFLARDRYGIKPLFFADTADAFWFASEAKALIGTAVPFQPREHAVLRFLQSGELPAGHGPDTFFEGIRQLAPGESMRVSSSGVRTARWYDLRTAAERSETPDEASALREMAAQVDGAVRLRLRADVPVGSCLSGGVDSSSIVGTMRGQFDAAGSGELHTFSAIYRERGAFNEEDWIKLVVAHSKARPHYTFPDEEPLDEMFEKMVWHQDEPFQTASIFAQWCVMKEARANGVIVLLDGQAADELLGGYQPGTYQEHFLEKLGTGRWLAFLRDWIDRKHATGLSWTTLLRELRQILVLGTTGVLWAQPDLIHPRQRLRSLAFRNDAAEQLWPKSQTDEAELRAKLAEDQDKLAKWSDKFRKKPDDADLKERIARKKAQISATRRKLATLNPASLRARLLHFRECLRVAWNRLHGSPHHDLRDLLLAQATTTSLAHLLRFEDRNSMAFSVEARVPFTDFQLVEWAFKRANDFKIHRGWTKWLLRTAMKGRAPEAILWRRDKTGFETPDVTMTRRLIAQCGRHPEDSPFLQHYLDPDLMRAVVARVKDGTGDRADGRLVWRWLVLDAWHRLFENAGRGTTVTPPS
ncbi:MAG: asparagine synthase (glutamine-hydrolyzing) [Verrucomicrobiaceae bacterium]|nr:asparagine synthase (glutamine-hydrolyzing) [Verrucomicrobiaceae bacterium]